MEEIKPIETVYRGYRFRSRLEARWAVFLDAMKLAWEYEPEGFLVGNDNEPYLPDFYLSQFHCYIEIKRDKNTFSKKELAEIDRKVVWFGESIAPIIVFWGLPSMGWTGELHCLDLSDSSGGTYFNHIGFAWCNQCGRFTLELSDEDRRFIEGRRHLYYGEWTPWNSLCDPEHRITYTTGELTDAVMKARAARFEHGESPNGHDHG